MHTCRRCNWRHVYPPPCDSSTRYPFFLFVVLDELVHQLPPSRAACLSQ